MDELASVLTDDLRNSPVFAWMRVDAKENTISLGSYQEPPGSEQFKFDRQLADPSFRAVCQKFQLTPLNATDPQAASAQTAHAPTSTNCTNALMHEREVEVSPGVVVYDYAAGVRNAGTLGWVWLLDDKLMGMTCHHVLFPGQSPNARADVTCDGSSVGSASPDFDPHRNLGQPIAVRDFAMIQFNGAAIPTGRLADNADRCSACSDSAACSKFNNAYPSGFGKMASLSMDKPYLVVGNSPLCALTYLRGFGLVNIVGHGDSYLLNHQLFFDRCTDNGDSGSILFDPESTNIVGMTCMGDGRMFTVASPWLFDDDEVMPDGRRWNYCGVRRYKGAWLPCYAIET